MKMVLSVLLSLLISMTSLHNSVVSATELEPLVSETVPVETMFAEMIDMELMPAETIPEETIPEETTPAETVAVEIPIQTELGEEAETEEGGEEVMLLPSLEELPTEDGYNRVPLYFQTDYPNNMFGSGTISSNGCSITSLAMVATYMTGHEYLPDELAGYFGGVAENNIERLEKGAEAMQLPWEKNGEFP